MPVWERQKFVLLLANQFKLEKERQEAATKGDQGGGLDQLLAMPPDEAFGSTQQERMDPRASLRGGRPIIKRADR